MITEDIIVAPSNITYWRGIRGTRGTRGTRGIAQVPKQTLEAHQLRGHAYLNMI